MRRFARISCGYLKQLKENNINQNRFVFTSSVQKIPCLALEWETAKETIFNNLNYSQQKRSYAPKLATNQRECWNCKKEHISEEHLMVCQHCGYLQDVNFDIVSED